MRCASPDCRRTFKPIKPWKKFCSKACGDMIRMRKYRAIRKQPASVFAISPSFTSEYLNPATLEKKINVYQDRLYGWVFNPVRELLKIPNGEFAAIAVLLCYFEGYQIWKTGSDSKNKSKQFFKEAFLDLYPQVEANKEAQAKFSGVNLANALSEKIYHLARCGFFHTGMAREGIAFLRIKGKHAFRTGINESGELEAVVIYPDRLVKDLETHHYTYVQALRDPKNQTLRENFETAWNLMHSGQQVKLPSKLLGSF